MSPYVVLVEGIGKRPVFRAVLMFNTWTIGVQWGRLEADDLEVIMFHIGPLIFGWAW